MGGVICISLVKKGNWNCAGESNHKRSKKSYAPFGMNIDWDINAIIIKA